MPFSASDLMHFCRCVIKTVQERPELIGRDGSTERLFLAMTTPEPLFSSGYISLVLRPDMGYPNMTITRDDVIIFNFNTSKLEDHGGALLAVADMTKAMARAYLRGCGTTPRQDVEEIGEIAMQTFTETYEKENSDHE